MPKIFKEYVLPHPKSDYDYEFEWKPIVIPKNKIVPFGYKAHPEDPDILLPVVRELDLMEDAKRHLKKFSYRDVAAWLTTQSGRSISADGLRRRVLSEKRHARKITNAEQLAERYRIAAEKAKKLEERGLGRRGKRGSDEGSSTSET